MLTDEQLIQRVRTALENESAGIVPPPALLAGIREELRRAPGPSRRLRLRMANLAPVAALLVVVAVVAVFLGVQSRKPAASAGAHGSFELVYRAEPTAQAPVVNQAAVARAVSVMRRRIALLGAQAGTATVTSAGARIFVRAVGETRMSQLLLSLVGTTARLEFYDWEANALTQGGKTVASLLPSQNPQALEISGQGSVQPGSPGAGSMPLYQAVVLASKQPHQASGDNARDGPEYFAFGRSGSAACTTAANRYHVTAIVGQPCYLAGPEDTVSNLYSALPSGVSRSDVQLKVIQRGTVVLQAIPSSYTNAPPWYSPTAQFFVLRDHVGLFSNEITNPRQSTDAAGQPDVTFGFTSQGASDFNHLTAQVARRGALLGGSGHQQENQHFAVALDTQLITVPYIDWKLYPDGISGRSGAELPGGFTVRSARDLATQLRLGALPVHLKLIASHRWR